MKKVFFAVVLAAVLLLSCTALAQEADFNSVKVCFGVKNIPGSVQSDVVLNLFDEAGSTLLDSKTVSLEKGKGWFETEFNVPNYAIGTKFKLVIASGADGASHAGEYAREHILETYSMQGENGEQAYFTTFYMELTPLWNKQAVIRIPGVNKTSFYHCVMDDEVYVTTDLLDALKINVIKNFDAEKPNFMLSTNDGRYTAQFFLDDIYALIGHQGINLSIPTFEIDGMPYVPLSKVAVYFACNYNVISDNIYTREITLTPSVYSEGYETAPKVESAPASGGAPVAGNGDYINSIDITSKTNYLIWVSKKDFSVNVYLGTNKNWRPVKSFPCSIGKPSTPTIEGQFEYYQYQPKWTYSKYYCGPVMRFYKGYAFHSYLIKYNGTPYDGRLGMQISAGCVRMHPNDIQWMVDYIPLHTKVLVTP